MKTPEQMADAFIDLCNDDDRVIAKASFLAGYQAAVNSPEKLDSSNSSNNSNGWISVKERLPEIVANCSISDDVLWLTRYGEIEVSFLETLRFEFRVDWGEAGLLKLDQFTHWMPLPKPPEEK